MVKAFTINICVKYGCPFVRGQIQWKMGELDESQMGKEWKELKKKQNKNEWIIYM
jgi:hypothetical protein